MLAVITEFVPATNTRPSRIKAYTCNGHKIIASRDDALADVQQHFAVAQKLIRVEVYGGSPKGYVFCFPASTISSTL